jgi:hypothetical protein
MTPTGASALTIDDTLVRSEIAAPNYGLQTFKSCQDMRTKVADFMELYYQKRQPNRVYPML